MLISGILLILQGFCGMGYGLFISAVARDEREAVDIAIGSVFPSLLISGTKYFIFYYSSMDWFNLNEWHIFTKKKKESFGRQKACRVGLKFCQTFLLSHTQPKQCGPCLHEVRKSIGNILFFYFKKIHTVSGTWN